ncbi:RNI-like protein [Calocera viscosa TUFC12733]|uniref:RNI-like protein n=1 Tax=Calocera viscosa (strain TUFC12733) TaxID=1330018 RepID=A0A167I928_CALVF|nr:RNI-like protein [Calocera viscosa TUFC12733]
MSRRAAANNRVRGPTSALTEFLREQGISARALSGYTRRLVEEGEENEEQAEGQATAAGPSATVPVTVTLQESAQAGPSRSRATRGSTTNANGYTSDNLDGDEEPSPARNGRKRKMSDKEMAKAKAKAKAEFERSKKRKLNGGGADDDDEEEEDEYTAKSKGGVGVGKADGVTPNIGDRDECAECGKLYTFTKYTRPADPGPGYLCPACTKAAGHDLFKTAQGPRKRKENVTKRKIVFFEENDPVPTLAELCLETIAKHIEDVDALGDIGSLNMDKIAKIIAKNRRLNASVAPLFYDITNENLTLYDCTALESSGLIALANLNPNLVNLRLDFCGRVEATALGHWAQHLAKLKRIELLAPFLVTDKAWIKFFETVGDRLEGFLITNSPRFSQECVESLVKNCPKLTELRLRRIGKLEDDWLPLLHPLTQLTLLDLSDASLGNAPISLTDEPLIDLMSKVGANLEHLDLSGHELVTDDMLIRGIAPNMPKLKRLRLVELSNLTDEGVGAFFDALVATPLHWLDLSRNPELADKALVGLLDHSGAGLAHLNMNQFKEASNEVLLQIGEKASLLEFLDLGFCREVDDFVVKAVQDGCKGLKELKVYGCNRITEDCPKKRGVRIVGVESHPY